VVHDAGGFVHPIGVLETSDLLGREAMQAAHPVIAGPAAPCGAASELVEA
jgi:hypothetical protein